MKSWILHAVVLVTLAPLPAHAEIYKWVDADGKTHYSDSKEHAGQEQAQQLKLKASSSPAQAEEKPTEYWQAKEAEFRSRRMQKDAAERTKSVAARPKSLSGGIDDGTDQGKCNLARDVLSGAVRHWNGKPTDQYDREVAENDVRTYCR